MTNIVAEHPEYEQALYVRKRELNLRIRQAGYVLTTPAGFAHQFYATSKQDARGGGRGRGRGHGANTGRFGNAEALMLRLPKLTPKYSQLLKTLIMKT